MSRKSVEVEVVVRELQCELTDTELLERGASMAECETEVENLRAERRRLNASMRDASNQRADLAKIIESKSETRDVSCQWEPDYENRRYDLVRLDTKAAIEQREMPEADLQMHLAPPTPIGKAKSSKKTAH